MNVHTVGCSSVTLGLTYRLWVLHLSSLDKCREWEPFIYLAWMNVETVHFHCLTAIDDWEEVSIQSLPALGSKNKEKNISGNYDTRGSTFS